VHGIEPSVLYAYVGERAGHAHPRFDEVDEAGESHAVTASIINRVTRRRVGAPDHDAFWVRLTQTYRIARGADPAIGLEPDAWSPLRWETVARVGDSLTIDSDVFYEHSGRARRFAVVDTDVLWTWSPYGDLFIGHRSTRAAAPDRPLPVRGDLLDPLSLNGLATETREAVDYLIAGGRINLPRGFVLANKTYYDRRLNRYAEIDYGLQYNAQCWNVTFTYQDFPEKNEFGVVVTLVGATSVDSKMMSPLFERQPGAPR